MDPLRRRLRKVFAHTDADVIVLMNTSLSDSNIAYLTGLNGIFEGCVLMATPSRIEFFATALDSAAGASRVSSRLHASTLSSTQQLRSAFAALKGKRIGINARFLPYANYLMLKRHATPRAIVDVSGALEAARMVKDHAEIMNIRRANRITKRAFSYIPHYFRAGITERQLAALLDNIMRSNGAADAAFATIVAFGANTAIPHHVPGETRLRLGQFILIDAGARYNGYCSDLTRTFIFDKETARRRRRRYAKMRDMYETVRKAQEAALRLARPGVECERLHNAAARLINTSHNGVYSGRFIHALGHSIGLDVHDGGFVIAPGCRTRLMRGMVFSNEPGIYIKGFGGVRLEDDMLITERGAVVL